MRLPGIILILVFLLSPISCSDGKLGLPDPIVDGVSVPGESMRGIIPVSYIVIGSGALPLQVAADFRVEEGDWQPATAAPGGGLGLGLLAYPEAREAVFLWDSFADLGISKELVKVRIRAFHPDGGGEAISEPFTVANDDISPDVVIDDQIDIDQGFVGFRVLLNDPDSPSLSLKFEYSADGGRNFEPATILESSNDLLASEVRLAHRFTWNAGVDRDWSDHDGVILSVVAFDDTGPGRVSLSKPFPLVFELPLSFKLTEFGPSLRGESPIAYTLYGTNGSRYSVRFLYSKDGEVFSECTRSTSVIDDSRNVSANPKGSDHVFIWSTRSDIPESVARNLSLRMELHTPGNSAEVLGRVQSTVFGIDNAAMVEYPLIGEVYIGDDPSQYFFEIIAKAGTSLDGYRLYEVYNGSDGIAIGRGVVLLDGAIVGDSGIFVIAGPDGPEADLVLETIDSFYVQGFPTNIVLDRMEADSAVISDSLGFGNPDPDRWSFRGEGMPAPKPESGKSLSRDFANTDADDNLVDFIISDPSPGEARIWSSEQ